jgi:hypothetical protein
LKCPRCNASSLIGSHSAISCLACGHVVREPEREAWDVVAAAARPLGREPGPPWTEEERELWKVAKK